MKRISGIAGVSALAIFGLTTTALAAEPEEISEVLLLQALAAFDVNELSSELEESLEGSLLDALKSNVVSPEVRSSVEEVIDAASDPSLISDALAVNQERELANWDEQSEVYGEAFQQVAQEFQECRDSEDGCSDQFRETVRSAWAEAERLRIEDLSAQLDAASDEDRESLQRQIQARSERLEQRVTAVPPGNSGNAPGQRNTPPENSDNPQQQAGSQQGRGNSNSGNSNAESTQGGQGNGLGNSEGGEATGPKTPGADSGNSSESDERGNGAPPTDEGNPGNKGGNGNGNGGGENSGNGNSGDSGNSERGNGRN